MVHRLIINADDFGWDRDTVAATIECFERGGLTSATIMPVMPATDAAVRYALVNPQFSFGAHLTWGGDGVERPVLPPEEVPALVGPNGAFLQSNITRLKALRGQIPVDQIERETAAQLASLVDRGLKLSHVDSHGHIHKFKPFAAALTNVLPKFGIRRVRNVQDVYLKPSPTSANYWLGGFWRRRIVHRFITTQHFYMGAGDDLVDNILAVRLTGDIEIGVHPAPPNHPDAWRSRERLAALELGARAAGAGLVLATWNDI